MTRKQGGLGKYVPTTLAKNQSRKLATVSVVLVVLMSTVGGFVFLTTQSAVAEDARGDLVSDAEVQGEEIGRWVGLMREEARLLSRAGPVKSRDRATVQEFIDAEIRAGQLPSEVKAIHYLQLPPKNPQNADWDVSSGPRIVASTNPKFKKAIQKNGQVFPREQGVPWAQKGTSAQKSLMETLGSPDADRTWVSPPFVPEIVGKPMVAIVSRIPGQRRALIIMVSLEAKSAKLPRPAGDDSLMTVVDAGTNQVLLSHDRSEILSSVAAGDAGASALETLSGVNGSGNATYAQVTRGGTDYATGFATVPGTDWVVMSQSPTSAAFATAHTIRNGVAVLVGVAVFGLLGIVLTVGRATSKSLADLTSRANALREGDLDMALESDRDDEFGDLYNAFGAMRDSLRERVEEAEEAQRRTERINERLERRADEYSDVMQRCADGDMTVRMDTDTDHDAMQEIAESFNGMIDELEAATDRLRSFSTEVATASEEVTASVEEVRNASERVASTTQSISQGADQQNEMFRTVSQEMSDLSATTEEIASSSNEVAQLADETARAGRKGRDRAQEAIATMDQVATEAEQSVDQFDTLQSEMEQIDELTELIAGLADQTNMLALNANIEASRAGDGSGGSEGFGAVAAEIKDLATEAKEAAQEADELIGTVRERTSETADVVERTSEEVHDSVDVVDDITEILNRVAERAEETSTGVREIDDATDRQAESAQEVVTQVREAANISSETAEESQDVAAATEEQTSALSEVAENVSQLSEQAAHLRELLDDFETRSPGTSVERSGQAGADD